MKDPFVIDDVLSKEDINRLLVEVSDPMKFEYQAWASRYIVSERDIPLLGELTEKLLPLARKSFDSETLLPTYTMFAHYEGQDPAPSLYKHKDDNACTYTLDLCVYQEEAWDLYVEDKAYTLQPNQALAYYGNDQWHWREEFPNPESNYVAMIFFHYAEPDHWWHTKGPGYLDVIRGNITEEEFDQINSVRS